MSGMDPVEIPESYAAAGISIFSIFKASSIYVHFSHLSQSP